MPDAVDKVSSKRNAVAASVASFLFGGVVVLGLGVLFFRAGESVLDKLSWLTIPRATANRPLAKGPMKKHAPSMQIDFPSPKRLSPVPTSERKPAEASAMQLVSIVLDDMGCILSDGQPMSADDLRAILELLSPSCDRQLFVVLTVDDRCPFLHFSQVQKICVDAGAAVSWK